MIARARFTGIMGAVVAVGLAAGVVGCRDSEAAPLHGAGAEAMAQAQPGEAPATATAKVEPAGGAGVSASNERAGAAGEPGGAGAGAAANPTLTLSAVGDCTLGSDYRGAGAEGSFHLAMDALDNDYSIPFAGVLSVLGQDDLTIANLETPLSRAKPAVNHPFVFNGKPEYAEILAKGSVEMVNLANNHTGDFGVEGARQTLAAVEKVGVGAFGNGRIDTRVVKGIEVVNIGYLGGGKGVRERVVKDVRKHKKPGNLVIVTFHWGVEGFNVPTDDQRTLGHAVVDAGADLVLGHHPHVLQGIESYKGRHIVYSLGNFVFGGHSNPADKDSMIYQEVFALEGGAVVSKESRVVPVRISSVTTRNDFRPVLLEGAERERVLARVKEYSEKLGPRRKR